MIQLPENVINVAYSLADASGEVIRQHFRTRVPIDIKSDDSPVTLADRQAEEAMRALIHAHFPDHGILGEELGSEAIDAPYLWVLDPIDGTRSFIAGRPLFGTLIALLHHGIPVLGMIDQPITKERWFGVAGHATTFNAMPIHARDCKNLSQAVLSTTSPHLFSHDNFHVFEKIRKKCKDTLYGGDCYAYGLVASGFMDMVMESGLKAHDFCAIAPIIEGAGGKVTDWHGQSLTLHSDGTMLACGNSALHAEALTWIGSDT